jgi:aminoglycoside phosphotransferase (APT) family kinase protein
VTSKLHDGEVDVDESLVRGLLTEQFPQFADASLERVQSTGTVNAIFRVGDDLCVRFPRIERWAADLEKELRWLPELAPRLTLRVPEPVARGEPDRGYPFVWAIYQWLAGEPLSDHGLADEEQGAADLAQFVGELREVDATGAPRSGRRPLRELDAVTRGAIAACGDAVDTEAATAAWDRALDAPAWDGPPVWRHCDLLTPNLLVDDGGLLGAVIDFGGAGVGDPAADVIAAWSVLGAKGRRSFRFALDVDDGTWARAWGYALHQALLIVPYYRDSNPDFVTTALRTIEEVLADQSNLKAE